MDTTTLLGYRDPTILEGRYATGIRNEELRNLAVADVNLDEGLLRVNRGKAGRDRLTPLGQIVTRFLKTCLNGIRPPVGRRPSHRPPVPHLPRQSHRRPYRRRHRQAPHPAGKDQEAPRTCGGILAPRTW